jgi:hypothetical protein
MDWDLARENRVLQDKIRALRSEVRFLKRLKSHDADSLLGMLQRRGMRILRMNPTDDLLFPPSAPKSLEDEFYHRLHHYSFRLFLRDLIKYKEDVSVSELTRYCSAATASEYLRFLAGAGAVKEFAPGRFQVILPVRSFGGTLEWYVHRLLREEYAVPALYGVIFKGTQKSGDYDILADLEGMLIYLELKSSPPRGIEAYQVSAFLDRVEELIPHGAIFLNDTELRMKDKLVPFFEQALKARAQISGTAPPPAKRLVDEIFSFGENLFLMNSRKSVSANIGISLRRLLQSRIKAGGPAI